MLLVIILIILNVYILLETGNKPDTVATSNEKWIVYGTMDCGWTRKQLEFMKNSGKQFEFIDCANNDCAGVNGFPTIIHPDGKKSVGYTEV